MADVRNRPIPSVQADCILLLLVIGMLNDLIEDHEGLLAEIVADLPNRHPDDAQAIRDAALVLAGELAAREIGLRGRAMERIERRARQN